MPADTILDDGFRCPACGDHPPLAAAGGALQALRCGPCGAALLPPHGAAKLRAVLGRAAASLDGAMSARAVTCPSCANATPLVGMPAGFAAPCAGCGTVWVDAALLGWAEARLSSAAAAPQPSSRGPAPSPSEAPGLVAPRPSTPASARALLLGAAAVAAGVTAVGLVLALRGEGRPQTSPTAWKDAPFARAADRPAPAATAATAVAPSAAAPAPRTPAVPDDLLLGGRPIEWWKARLERLRGTTDEASRALYEATLRRAEANGLVVTIEGSAVTVKPGEALLHDLEGER